MDSPVVDERHLATLPDGSVCTARPIGPAASIVSRWVDGVCVWGQAFSAWSDEEHTAQVDRLVGRIVARPAGFRRWWLPELTPSPVPETGPLL